MKISVVATLYKSARFLPQFYRRITETVQSLTDDYEIVLVNDGSPDESLDIAVALHQADPRVRVIDLSRNFGHHKAMMTGLQYSRGDYVFLIDCDLEEEPELLRPFFETLQANPKADVVYGVQESRKGGVIERATGRLYFWLIDKLWDQAAPRDVLVARLMTRRYVRALVAHRESELIIGGLWQATGFVQIPVAVKKHSNPTSTYTFTKKMGLVFRSITAYSNRPLLYIAYIGITILLLSLLYVAYLIGEFLFARSVPEGYTSIIVSLWFLGGLITFSIGIVAIYLSMVFTETKHRPYTIIRDVYEAVPLPEQTAAQWHK